MAFVDYYLVLGVTRDANGSQIRRAHRSLSHLHEDLASRLDELQQALDTLADPRERREHDERLTRADELPAPHDLAPPAHLFDSFETFRPSLGAIRSRWDDNFTHR